MGKKKAKSKKEKLDEVSLENSGIMYYSLIEDNFGAVFNIHIRNRTIMLTAADVTGKKPVMYCVKYCGTEKDANKLYKRVTKRSKKHPKWAAEGYRDLRTAEIAYHTLANCERRGLIKFTAS